MNLGTNSKYEKIVANELVRLGIPRNILGYEYLKYAISVCIEDYRQIRNLTKGLYPSIALKYDSTGSRVERAIRHAIKVSLKRADVVAIDEFFGCSTSKDGRNPTNGEFIAAISDHIRLNLKTK